MLAKGEVIAHFKKNMQDRDYETLCDLLKRMIEFCRTVEWNDVIKAQFDQLKWYINDTSKAHIAKVIQEKNRYEKLLKGLNEEK